jgi:rhamnogalacturonan endolyase
MFSGPVYTRFPLIVILLLISSCSGNVMQTTVFSDGFDELDPMIVRLTDSDDAAIYYRSDRGVAGNWRVATTLRQEGFNDAWQIRKSGNTRILVQNFTNLDPQNEPLSLITHPIIMAGDSLWNDFMIEADFTPLAKFDKCGIIFGYKHPNDFYFFGTEGNTVILKHIQQLVTPLRPIERILVHRPLVWTPGEKMHAMVTIRRNKISTILNDTIRMFVEGEQVRSGKIGLISDLPAEFERVEVKMLKGELRKLTRKKRQLNRKQELYLDGHPKMVRWKTFDISDFGTNQNVRIGDLTGNGNKEFLFVCGDRADPSVIRCISAMDLDGRVIWQYGEREGPAKMQGPELPVQIHDLDGDGEREVLFVSDGMIHMLKGKSGSTVRRERIPADMKVESIIFGDLLGTGRDNCILLSDCDHHLAALNERLEQLWEMDLDGGSLPQVYDMDGDGHDEVMFGYSVIDHEGNLIFNTGAFIGDRCNGVSAFELMEGDRNIPCLIYAAGDWGLMFVDFEGQIRKQNIIGHVEYLSVADFDMEVPGLEVVTSNSWGSDGLIHACDASGQIIQSYMPVSGVSRCVPVNWKGDGEEFFMMNADSINGGMYDMHGQLSVQFPSDGHPTACYLVQDLTGDARDEVVVWDSRNLWIYTQDDNPRMGKTYNPDRYPLYNYSMHRMNLSLPGW